MSGCTNKLGLSAIASALILSLASSYAVSAFEYPLSEERVREAYFLGRTADSEKLKRFTDQYTRYTKDDLVGRISLYTPYALAVLRSQQNQNYSAQQAQEDYQNSPDQLIVTVAIFPTEVYSDLFAPSSSGIVAEDPANFVWHGWRVYVTQELPIESKKLTIQSIDASRPDNARTQMDSGAEMLLEFGVQQFDSSSKKVKVSILRPDGKCVNVEFDIGRLR